MLSKFNKLLHFKYKKINSLLPILFDIFMLFKEYFMLTKYYGLLYFEDKKVIPSYFTPFFIIIYFKNAYYQSTLQQSWYIRAWKTETHQPEQCEEQLLQ